MIKRYEPDFWAETMCTQPDGSFVNFEDYAELTRRVERMTAVLKPIAQEIKDTGNEYKESDWNPDAHIDKPITLTVKEARAILALTAHESPEPPKVKPIDCRCVNDELCDCLIEAPRKDETHEFLQKKKAEEDAGEKAVKFDRIGTKECVHSVGDLWERKEFCPCLVTFTKKNYPTCPFCTRKDGA